MVKVPGLSVLSVWSLVHGHFYTLITVHNKVLLYSNLSAERNNRS